LSICVHVAFYEQKGSALIYIRLVGTLPAPHPLPAGEAQLGKRKEKENYAPNDRLAAKHGVIINSRGTLRNGLATVHAHGRSLRSVHSPGNPSGPRRPCPRLGTNGRLRRRQQGLLLRVLPSQKAADLCRSTVIMIGLVYRYRARRAMPPMIARVWAGWNVASHSSSSRS
jgi:hypothetical protein